MSTRAAVSVSILALILVVFGCGTTSSDPTGQPAGGTPGTDAGVGGAGGAGAAGGGVALSSCAHWSEDPLFGTLESDGRKLTDITAVWGLSDDDIHVAVVVADPVAPNTDVAALAHWDGSTWRVEPLPGTRYVRAISGTSSADIWMLSTAYMMTQPSVMHSDGGPWTTAPLGYPIGFDLTMLGPGDGLAAISPTHSVGQGFILRLAGGQWVPMPNPQLDVPFTIVKMHKLDAMHVYAIAEAADPDFGTTVLASFDGTSWTAIHMPKGVGFRSSPWGALDDVVAVSPDRIYVLATVGTGMETHSRIYRVSADLSTWTPEVELPFSAGSWGRQLAATAGGNVVAALSGAEPFAASVMTLQKDGSAGACGIGSAYYFTPVVWSAPGSPDAHIFGPSNEYGRARHWRAQIDP